MVGQYASVLASWAAHEIGSVRAEVSEAIATLSLVASSGAMQVDIPVTSTPLGRFPYFAHQIACHGSVGRAECPESYPSSQFMVRAKLLFVERDGFPVASLNASVVNALCGVDCGI